MPKISVIMPVYNTEEEYLREAIESILNQTYKDFEFIIVNDGSTNNAEDVILSYKDERIRYHFQENQGIATALNNGFDMAQGEYIARMDSDDISLPDRFAKQVEFLDNNPDIALCGTWYETFPKKQIVKFKTKIRYLDVLRGFCICHPTVMFRRADFINMNLKYNSNYACEDYELWSRAVLHVSISNIQEVLLMYRCHRDNTSVKNNSLFDSAENVKQNMLDFLTEDITLQKKILSIIQGYERRTIKLFGIKISYKMFNKD